MQTFLRGLLISMTANDWMILTARENKQYWIFKLFEHWKGEFAQPQRAGQPITMCYVIVKSNTSTMACLFIWSIGSIESRTDAVAKPVPASKMIPLISVSSKGWGGIVPEWLTMALCIERWRKKCPLKIARCEHIWPLVRCVLLQCEMLITRPFLVFPLNTNYNRSGSDPLWCERLILEIALCTFSGLQQRTWKSWKSVLYICKHIDKTLTLKAAWIRWLVLFFERSYDSSKKK